MPKSKEQKRIEAKAREESSKKNLFVEDNTKIADNFSTKSLKIHSVYNKKLYLCFARSGQGGLNFRSVASQLLS